MWLGNIFDHDGNVIVPCSYGLIVRCGYESAVVIHECDAVHWPKMLVVFLDNFGRVHVVLSIQIRTGRRRRVLLDLLE